MSANVTVSSCLLEDIFRLLDYLDELELHKSGHAPRLSYDNAFRDLQLKIQKLRQKTFSAYLLTIDNITESEMQDLHEWVASGNSVYDNPCLMSDESGRPMDFINGCRMAFEMANDTSIFFGDEPDSVDGGGWDDELPFSS